MIRSFSEKLVEHLGKQIADDETAQKYISYVADGAERSQKLIAEVLLYSSIDKEVRMNEQVSLNEVMGVIRDNLHVAIEENGAEFTYDELPEIVGNKTQLYQLFLNLVANGMKYQQPGTKPRVHVSYDENDNHYTFRVSDNGIGIDKKHIHKVFDVFQRLHRKDQYQGTGIGLSICKKIVERHNGKIWIDSKLNVGSKFYIQIPKV